MAAPLSDSQQVRLAADTLRQLYARHSASAQNIAPDEDHARKSARLRSVAISDSAHLRLSIEHMDGLVRFLESA